MHKLHDDNPVPFSQMHNIPVTRHRLLGVVAKMFCSACQRLQVVVDYFPGGKPPVKLRCGHRRGIVPKD